MRCGTRRPRGTFVRARVTGVQFNHGSQPTYSTNKEYTGVFVDEAIFATQEEAMERTK